ncbi:juvenile hormone esterase-like [Tribolium madens]|uniref:juvenile hormone esterase-like n=1 Tax=Tribolium madens TaxID=41895 RepID=UPI001CF75A76|nr:juvenile hormone esterase-like [Tribolium madens]
MARACLFVVFTLFQAGFLFGPPEVQLPTGVIRGREDTTVNNKQYFAFEKIPYAAPPIGDLRFKAPVPPPSWEDPLDTLNLDVSCYQVSGNSDDESEDCLYINVFTPQLPSDGTNASLPVMLYIHGGGFMFGSGRNTYSDYIIEEDVIFATINYRLGPFGFLSTEDHYLPGNNGLKDQHLALKWTHDNIHLFGGDPDKITIMGQSAGSASVAYQLLNQKSTGLFRGAILESGSFLSPFAFQRRAREIAFATAAFINDTFETTENSEELFEFLKGVDAKDLDLASQKYHESETLETAQILTGRYYSPVIEEKNPDAFLTKKMYRLLKAGNVVRVPILIGITSEEGLVYNSNQDILTQNMAAFDENVSWLVPKDMMLIDDEPLLAMGTQIKSIYVTGNLSDQIGAGVRYYSDHSFTRSVIKTAELYSNFSDTFFYQFSYDGPLGGVNIHYDGAGNVGHAEELNYLFCRGSGCKRDDIPDSDKLTRQRLIKLWTNFAKYQNPTPEAHELLQNVTWPKVSTESGDFLYLDIDENLEVKNHPKEETYSKWVGLYESLGYDNFDTY